MSRCIHAYKVTLNGSTKWVCFQGTNCENCPGYIPIGTVKVTAEITDGPKIIRSRQLSLAAKLERGARRITTHDCCDSGKPPSGYRTPQEQAWLRRLGIGKHK